MLMKKFVLSIILSVCLLNIFAAHIKGGFLTYKYLGPGTINSSNLRYKITLTVYMTCDNLGPGQLSNPINLTVFRGDGVSQFDNPSVNITNQYRLGKASDEPCITGDQSGCYYTIVEYELSSYELPVSAEGFTISYQRCCRIASMDNIQNSAAVGNTYSIKIPGTSSAVPNANKNSSPDFGVNDTAVVCGGSFFSFPLGATDPDGDVLVYSLCAAFEGGSTGEPAPNPAAQPPYGTVSYQGGFSGSQPMGNAVNIDPRTGVLSGIAPLIVSTGEYVVTVCVTEYRNGVYLAESRKELHIRVRDCIPLKAILDPKPVTCDGFSVNFSNAATLPTGSIYEWNFGDQASGAANTSTSPTPSHTYTDSGVYTIKLKVSSGGGLCADSTTSIVKVYPGFFPAFNIDPPYCKGTPVQFIDQTTSNYGRPTGWRWNFGNNAATDDTSRNRSPVYTYPDAGIYTIKLVVSNTFGCTDSTTRQVTIADNPLLKVIPKDTTYCSLDSVTLTATGTGNFNWLPAVSIIGANTASPTVFPAVPTKYFVSLNAGGCISRDSVTVNPVNNVTASITASATTICEQDTLTLTGNSNYTNTVTWLWSPSGSVQSATSRVTKAFPAGNTQYTLTARWGRGCTASATQNITVNLLAIPDAGPPAAICKGQGTAQLQASGGIRYQWVPATGLSNPNISNPIASPAATTTYKVFVGVAGCTGTKADSVTVLVRALPQANLVDDTLICSIDTLQLKTNPAANYVWSPNYMINSLTAASPLVSPDIPTTYYTTLTDQFGCINKDSAVIDVKLFVTIEAGKDTAICRTDTFHLRTVSDAVSYQWSPSTYLDNDKAKNPIATPLDSFITYRVIGNIGKCQSRDSVTIRTVPYPVATINNPPGICFGGSATLQAAGGSSYAWVPVTFLSASNIAAPVSVKPTADILYTVSVKDTFGCPKAVTASTWVRVRPPVLTKTGIRDTSIVIGQSIQLNASGGDQYVWEPALWLSDINSPKAIASPEENITYKVTVTQLPENCTGTDTVRITVFKLPPSFYVPTAFSPNGDGRNDVLRPKALGMRTIRYFKVYNRLGQLVFETTELNKGWDGTYKGNPQDPAAYVWMAQGETYKGELITRKGSAVLVR
jgi:gliding motility-associated-like protein